ncbi:MAG: hypothetical protein KKE44_04145, partial [Proteobacteria bacterium]|nr:hypothetical protein [Pseudomonadota bacterium]MBU1581921.1 hypothetical protein [Pseudomonadota bacterium]
DVITNPFFTDSLTQLKIDINKNERIDEEDLLFLEHLYDFSNPYIAEQTAKRKGINYPRPREFFKYLPKYEYVQRPLFLLKHPVTTTSPFLFLRTFVLHQTSSPYEEQLLHEIYNEALRFSFAYNLRKNQLTRLESEYVSKKIQYCDILFEQKKYDEALLGLISLVEDAETLTIKTQSEFIKKILFFRDNLKALLVSKEFSAFNLDRISYQDMFKTIEGHLKSDLDIALDLNSLSAPRDLSNLKNYIDRAEWQAFKSKTKRDDFKQLVLYAQYDRRYLRTVSKTSPKLTDIQLQNHNLPMILLFRKALKIAGNDKKSAVGLLDEAIRIPLGWVKSIPKNLLPGSVALENFLLPGNKEDGSDKSRHWNVFGGVAIYKSPEESLILALKREIMDLKEQNYSQEAMTEFIRDTIANINGIYYVVSIDPNLIKAVMAQHIKRSQS